jgi:hypothetical protein
MLGVAPILPSRDLEATPPDTDPVASVAGCYLYVSDADGAPQVDGNLLRIGSG